MNGGKDAVYNQSLQAKAAFFQGCRHIRVISCTKAESLQHENDFGADYADYTVTGLSPGQGCKILRLLFFTTFAP
ncbi:hypothetical protein Barb6_02729 [Bacteroidales bacterium Barb6]|nr:hypothetical protein Barb6_02729 [Bacteroidales bacterium Barb6]